MKPRALLFLFLALLAHTAVAATLQPYRTGDWKDLVRNRGGQPLIVHFWGISCGPCVVELPKWGRFMRERPDAKVVFIEVDQAPAKVTLRILGGAKLDNGDIRALASPYDEYMRYEVDAKWMGELPSTMLVGVDGKVTRLSGSVDFAALRSWLGREKSASPGK
jgi:thiol-disulfide isomerase/thioredoxin